MRSRLEKKTGAGIPARKCHRQQKNNLQERKMAIAKEIDCEWRRNELWFVAKQMKFIWKSFRGARSAYYMRSTDFNQAHHDGSPETARNNGSSS